MKIIEFNLNDNILVQLNDYGKLIWKRNQNTPAMIKAGYELTDEFIEEKKDSDGYWKFQLWEFIYIFGPYILKSPCNLWIKLIIPDEN